jgi:hypothetical protein
MAGDPEGPPAAEATLAYAADGGERAAQPAAAAAAGSGGPAAVANGPPLLADLSDDEEIQKLKAELARERKAREKRQLAEELERVRKQNEIAARAAETQKQLEEKLKQQAIEAAQAAAKENEKKKAEEEEARKKKAVEDEKAKWEASVVAKATAALQSQLATANKALEEAKEARKLYEQAQADKKSAGGSNDDNSGGKTSWDDGKQPQSGRGSSWAGGGTAISAAAGSDSKGSDAWQSNSTWENPGRGSWSAGGKKAGGRGDEGAEKDMGRVLNGITSISRYSDARLGRKIPPKYLACRTWVPLLQMAEWSGQKLEDIESAVSKRTTTKNRAYFYTLAIDVAGKSYAAVAEAEEQSCLAVYSMSVFTANHDFTALDSQAERRQKQVLLDFKKAWDFWHRSDGARAVQLWYGAECFGGQHQAAPAASPKGGAPAPPQSRATMAAAKSKHGTVDVEADDGNSSSTSVVFPKTAAQAKTEAASPRGLKRAASPITPEPRRTSSTAPGKAKEAKEKGKEKDGKAKDRTKPKPTEVDDSSSGKGTRRRKKPKGKKAKASRSRSRRKSSRRTKEQIRTEAKLDRMQEALQQKEQELAKQEEALKKKAARISSASASVAPRKEDRKESTKEDAKKAPKAVSKAAGKPSVKATAGKAGEASASSSYYSSESDDGKSHGTSSMEDDI